MGGRGGPSGPFLSEAKATPPTMGSSMIALVGVGVGVGVRVRVGVGVRVKVRVRVRVRQ